MDVLMPQLGETVAEGKIVKWFKSAGDAVKPGDNLFEIETDKTSMEVPATVAGTLADIRFQVGEVAKVGAVVAVIAGAGERSRPPRAAASRPPRPRSAAAAGVAGARSPAALQQVRASARTSARIAYPTSTPSAKCARRNAISGRPSCPAAPSPRRWRAGWPASAASIFRASPAPARMAASSPPTSKGPRRRRPRARRAGASAAQVKALYEGIAYEEVPLDAMRRTIATRLVEAKQTIPHFYLTADIEIGRLMAMREEANAAAPKDGRRAGLQALAQRLHDQGLGGGAACACRPPMRCLPRTASCASRMPTSAWRWRSTAG